MHLEYSATNATGYTINYVEDMDVVQVTSTAYIVNVTESSTQLPGQTFSEQFKVEMSGTVDWAYSKIEGFTENETSLQAQSLFEEDMATYELEASSNQVYGFALLTQYFNEVNGTNSIFLTNAATGKSIDINYQTYVPNSSNEAFGYCGTSIQITQFKVEIGTINNSNVQVLLSYAFKGTVNGNAVNFSINLAWIWLESS